MAKQSMDKYGIGGLIAAPHTPMHRDYSLNTEIINIQSHTLQQNGVEGAFLCGTTGEGMVLTESERKRVASEWVAQTGGELSIIVHVGSSRLAQAKRLASHAEQELQVDAIAAMGPVIFKTETVEALVEYCAKVAAEAPNTPFYYYHIPSFSGIDLPMIEFLEVGSRHIPTLAGIKYTHSDLYDYGLCLNYDDGNYNILFGQDENLLAGLALGARGAVGSTYNFASPLYRNIIESFNNGEMETARFLQTQSREMVQIFKRYGIFASLKAAMRIIGIDVGPNRPPVSPLGEKSLNNLTRDLENLGFFNFCSEVDTTIVTTAS